MRIVDKIIGKVGTDKALHFLLCGWLESICCHHGLAGMFAGVLLLTALSLIKEAIDRKFDWGDIIAGECGGLTAALIYVIDLMI